MLLLIEALLLILAALQDHTAAAENQIYPLDMALNSVDDQFEGCTNDMENLVITTYLKKDINRSQNYAAAWKEGEGKYNDKLIFIAIHAYTNNKLQVYRHFNNEVRNGKSAYKDLTYNWYSLHFLLTKAIQSLKGTCYDTFRGANVNFKVDVGSEIRFGSFTSSSLDRTVTQGFGRKSCFEIYTCEGADIHMYSKYPEEKEVLIPPYETFKVTAVKHRSDQKDLWCEVVFVLNSTGTRSDLNCAVIPEKGKL